MRIIGCLTLLAALVLAGEAQAVVVYERTASHAIVAARSDGSHPRIIAHGYLPVVAPDGEQVIFVKPGQEPYADLWIASIAGGGARRLLRVAYLDPDTRSKNWSPNSRYVIVGDERSGATHILDLETATDHVIGNLQGTYGGASFGPDSRRVVIDNPPVEPGRGELVVRDTQDHNSQRVASGDSPLWGPAGLAFTDTSAIKLKPRLDRPAESIFVRTQKERWAWPVDWSPRGRLLLVARGHLQDQVHAYLVRPADHHVVTVPGTFTELDAMSHDSNSILGVIGGNVVRVTRPGAVQVLGYAARSPSWTE